MWVRYENDDTISKYGTLRIKNCDAEASFYVNNVHHSELSGITFCENEMYFRAEVEDWESLEWWINGTQETAANNLKVWDKILPNGTYEVELLVIFQNGEEATVTSTFNVFKPWIKIRNIRKE